MMNLLFINRFKVCDCLLLSLCFYYRLTPINCQALIFEFLVVDLEVKVRYSSELTV